MSTAVLVSLRKAERGVGATYKEEVNLNVRLSASKRRKENVGDAQAGEN